MSGEQTGAWLDEIVRRSERVNAGLYYVGAEDFDALAAAVRAALDLHKPFHGQGGDYCDADGFVWPCPTYRAVAAALADTTEVDRG